MGFDENIISFLSPDDFVGDDRQLLGRVRPESTKIQRYIQQLKATQNEFLMDGTMLTMMDERLRDPKFARQPATRNF